MRGPASLTPQVLAEHCTVTARVDVWYGREVVAAGVPLLSGSFESTLRRDSQDKVVMRFADDWLPRQPWDPLEVHGQRSQLFVDVARPGRPTETVSLGFFQHDVGRPVRGGQIEVTAYGLLVLLADDPFPWPSSPKKGASFGDEVARLARPHLGVEVSDSMRRGLLPGGLAWGTDRLKALRDLAAGQGAFLRVENDGRLGVYDERLFSSPVVEYSSDDLVLGAPDFDWERRPNVFTATGERDRQVQVKKGRRTESKTVTDRWDATVSAVGVRDPKAYGTVRELISVQKATSALSVEVAAGNALRGSAVVVGERSFEMVPDPRLQVGDVAAFVVEDPVTGFRETTTGRVVGLLFDLVSLSASSMRCDVEVLAW